MAAVRLGVGCQRQSKILKLRLAGKPLLLFRDPGRIRPEEGKSVESLMEPEVIHLSGLRLVDDVSRAQVRCTRCLKSRTIRVPAGSSQSPLDMCEPLCPVPRLHLYSRWR